MRGVRHAHVRSVTVYLDGKRVAVQRGSSKQVRIHLGGRPRATVRVLLAIETSTGKRLVDQRRYRTCAKR